MCDTLTWCFDTHDFSLSLFHYSLSLSLRPHLKGRSFFEKVCCRRIGGGHWIDCRYLIGRNSTHEPCFLPPPQCSCSSSLSRHTNPFTTSPSSPNINFPTLRFQGNPFDVLKTRMMAAEGEAISLVGTAQTILKTQGAMVSRQRLSRLHHSSSNQPTN